MSLKEHLKETAKMLEKYFMEDVTLKVTGESAQEYYIDLIIDMDGFYLKTSFTALKERVDNWKREKKL